MVYIHLNVQDQTAISLFQMNTVSDILIRANFYMFCHRNDKVMEINNPTDMYTFALACNFNSLSPAYAVKLTLRSLYTNCPM